MVAQATQRGMMVGAMNQTGNLFGMNDPKLEAIEKIPFVKSPWVVPIAKATRRTFVAQRFGLPVLAVLLLIAAQFGRVAEIGALILLVVPLVVWGFSQRVRGTPKRGNARVPAPRRDPEKSLRLRCIGHPLDIAELAGVNSAPFEPIIVYRLIPTSSKFYRWMLAWGVLPVYITCSLLHTAAWVVFAFLSVVPWVFYGIQSLRPRCYRIVPGRLDVLQFTFWRDKGTTVEALDLRTAEVTCNFESRMLAVRSAGADGPARTFDLLTMADPLAFARGVFQAALCKAVPGSLPQDELLG